MIVYDKEQKQIVIPNGIGNIDIYNNGVEAGYNQGYEQGQAVMAANARVLNVTENGTYMSKYSGPIISTAYTVTGVYDDGTEFYDYAELNGKVFNTKIAGSIKSRLEFWYKGDNTLSGYVNNVIIGSGDTDKDNSFQVKYFDNKNNGIIRVRVGKNFGDIYDWDNTVWHHLIISKPEGGVWIDGIHKFYFVYDGTIDGEFFINGIGYDVNSNANGYFGMIKIDDTIIIPTANGFKNVNTGELLEVVKDGGYTYTENVGELYKTINVNVPDLNGSYDEGYVQGKTDGINEQKSKLETINITENGTYTKEDGYNHIEVNVPDLNGSYDEGYGQGKTDGVNEQKGKLVSINITENGTYSKEDGYNHIEVNVPDLNGSYDEGYKKGKTDLVAFARVLDVTENGVYKSRFFDSIDTVTGVYADGDNFYNYAELNGKVFNTKIAGTADSRLEFWYKGDHRTNKPSNIIIGSGNDKEINSFQVRYDFFLNKNIKIYLGSQPITIKNWNDRDWHHFIISKAEGLWIDGEKKGDFSSTNTINGEFFINGIGYSADGKRSANGTFGMIKIDDTTIIPTEDGFLNTNTRELLEVVNDGGYKFAGDLYKAINVNVPPKINPQKEGLRLGYSTFTEVPKWVDFNGVTDMSNMFRDCKSLKTIPLINTSKVTNMSYMFYNCTDLQTIPLINTSKVTNMSYMFGYSNLQTIPQLITSNVTDMKYMFFYCGNLQTIPQIDTSNVTSMDSMFSSCSSLVSLPALNAQSLSTNQYSGIFGYVELTNLTDFGGFLNLKCSLESDYNFKSLPNLTYESCINVLNGLYDFTGNGETPNNNQGKLKVHQNFLDKVGEEISIGVNKGWTITV